MAFTLGIPSWAGRLDEDSNERTLEPQYAQFPTSSPLWWVHRLYSKLMDRLTYLNIFDNYYTGDFPMPWIHEDAEDEFRRVLRMGRANYCGLIVDAQVERMAVEGFRIDTGKSVAEEDANLGPVIPSPNVTGSIGAAAQGKALNPSVVASAVAAIKGSVGVSKTSQYTQTTIGEADRETWRIWQANNMDTLFDQAILESAINGMSYLMVAPNDDDPKTPKMWVEHPAECIVEHVPGSNRSKVAAGLKVWNDDWNRVINATLYVVEDDQLHIYKYYAEKPRTVRILWAPEWLPRTVDDEQWPAVSADVDIVPIFELPNNPRMLSGGRSELYDIIDTQDRIVKTIVDRLITQDFGAFPQKWASGLPDTDASGNPNAKIDVGQDRMITSDAAETKFGQFAATDLAGFIQAKQEDIRDMAARTRTPAQYLLGEFSKANGETLKASESGLVAKVRQRMRGMDDPLEAAIRFARQLAGTVISDDVTMEVVWRNPEFRTEGEVVDALTKMSTLGVPQQALWERWGASPPEIERWTQMQVEYQKQQAAADATSLLADSVRRNNAAVAAGPANQGPAQPGGANGAGQGSPGSSSKVTGTAAAAGAAGGGSRNGGGNGRL